uniref:Large ribosomal subunit protein mL44 n=1 Tax=Syphacia muris TaxID=451379 RepID=A0A0N5AVV1_9BILA
MFSYTRFNVVYFLVKDSHSMQRSLRTRWEQGYLKDLYHRRVLCGAEPLIHRSAYPNWNYDTEIFAFSHRIGSPETSGNCIIKALTDKSFYARADVVENTVGAQPNEECCEDNSELIEKGFVVVLLTGYLRYALPAAPEEMIEAIAKKLTSEVALSQIAKSLGFKHIIRTAEFPPNSTSLANSFKALLAVINRKRAEALAMNTVLPRILDVDFIEVLSLKDPLGVVIDICHSEGIEEVEPRILHSAGVTTAEPIYLVGIFGDGKLIGKGPGETVGVAVHMAAWNTLLKKWQLTDEFVIPLGSRVHDIRLQDFQSPNYYLKEKCSTDKILEQICLLVCTMAVGIPFRKRLRHKFSRGSIHRRDLHRMLKPKPFTVS